MRTPSAPRCDYSCCYDSNNVCFTTQGDYLTTREAETDKWRSMMRRDLNQNERMFAKLFDLVVVQYKKLSKTSDFAETVGTAVTPK